MTPRYPTKKRTAFRAFSPACCAWKHAHSWCPPVALTRAAWRSSSACASQRSASRRFAPSFFIRFAMQGGLYTGLATPARMGHSCRLR